ncbi:AAA family ATPase [Candidatus Culexarchaeum yellowstonense]|uniref:AAA family ATPase n=1 Tax=Candidatus Culexarchaeum yellowstonense TaxID=2928963 RepID=UPI0026F0C515|nr:AAA family ATPase [Candidatus Culexarchaeum yellowstonense]
MCLTGMPGSGKTTISEIVKEMGIPVIVMGDVVREEARIRGIEPTPKNLGKLMIELREKMGANVIAKRCVDKIKELNSKIVLVEGVRSLEEVEEFRKVGDVKIVAVHSSPKTRYERLSRRGRSDDPKSWEEFGERDLRELDVGIGRVISLADEMIINEGTLEDLKKNTLKVFRKVIQNDKG